MWHPQSNKTEILHWFRTIKILEVKLMKYDKDTIAGCIMTTIFIAEMYVLILIFH